MKLVALPLMAVLLVASASPALANPDLERAKRLLDEFKERRALQALRKAARRPNNTPGLRATIEVYRGIAHFNLLAWKKAKSAFRRALKIHRQVELPPRVSPKIRKMFNKIKAKLPAAPKQPKRPTEPPPDSLDTSGSGTVPTVEGEGGPELIKDTGTGTGTTQRRDPPPTRPAEPDDRNAAGGAARPDPSPPTDRSQPAGQRTINWPAWLSLGLAVAAGGAGIGLGIAASSAEGDATDLNVPWYAAEVHHANAKDRALVANILYGVAGAAAIASTVLFITGRKKTASRLSAGATVTPGGDVVLQLGGQL